MIADRRSLRPDCPVCGGSGEIRFNRSPNHDPQHDDTEPCRACNGTGEAPRD